MIAFYVFILSLALSTVAVPYLAHWSSTLGLLDQPGERKIHLNPVPRVGGIAIAAGTLISLTVWVPFTDPVAGYLIGALIITVFGIADDISNLDFRLKFLGQIIAALLFVYVSDIWLTRAIFGFNDLLPYWLGLPLTIFWIVGVTNAINLSDGMDGLAGGTSLLASVALGYLAFSCGDKLTALLALAVIAAVVGFLRYNTFPARVFMGDTGSQFLGFSVAVLSLILIENSNRAMSPLVPLLMLGLPISDTLFVIYQRVHAGGSPFYPDRRHLHHRLLDFGLNQYEVVLVIYMLQILWVLSAWFLRYSLDILLLGFFVTFNVTLYWGVSYWETHETHARTALMKASLVDRLVTRLKATNLLMNTARDAVVYGLVLMFPAVALGVPHVSADIGWLALMLGMSLALALFIRAIPLVAVERLSAFVLAIAVVYLVNDTKLLSSGVVYTYIGLLAFGISLWLRFGSSSFHVNSLDVLIILIVISVPNMPFIKGAGLGAVFVQALVLFYACELVISQRVRQQIFRAVLLLSLIVLAFRGIVFSL